MLVAGDSTAEFLGRGLEQRPELNVTNLGNRGCAFLDSDPPVELQDSSGYATWGRHTTGKNCDWRTYLPAAPTDFDVAVVFAAPTMLVNIELPDGSRVSVADPRGREFLRSSLARLSVELRRHARRVVWMTAPTSQYAVGSGPWLWSDENRTVAWNALVVETARATGGSLIDFRSWFMAQPDNDQFRPDGAHLEGRGAELAAEWLATEVLAPTP